LGGSGKKYKEQPNEDEKQERGPLIVKLKIPPRRAQPLPPLLLVESDDEDDESGLTCTLGYPE
jgi:hypothetical protein